MTELPQNLPLPGGTASSVATLILVPHQDGRTGGPLLRGYALCVARAAGDAGTAVLHSPALQLVLAERLEQVEQHGYTPDHDDHHGGGEIAMGAGAYLAAYIADGVEGLEAADALSAALEQWPWRSDLFRPTGEVEMLTKATAMLLAELDRVLRLQAKAGA